jgi:hypothetical protein
VTVRHRCYPVSLIWPTQASRSTEVLRFSTATFFNRCDSMSARARHRVPAQEQALACRRRFSVRYRRANPRARGLPRWGTRPCSVSFPPIFPTALKSLFAPPPLSAQYCGAVVCGLADEHIAEHQAGTVARHKRDTSKPIAARLAKQCERKRQRLDLDSGPAVGA